MDEAVFHCAWSESQFVLAVATADSITYATPVARNELAVHGRALSMSGSECICCMLVKYPRIPERACEPTNVFNFELVT